MNRRDFLAAATAALVQSKMSWASSEPEEVDVELILAVDASRSIDREEMRIQLEGYAQAFRDPRLIERIEGGPLGQVACMMFVWSDFDTQLKVADWRKICDPASAEAFALEIDRFSRASYSYTSITAAIDFAMAEFGSHYSGTRKVLDISGDGPNNAGGPVDPVREKALEEGIVINGLAILNQNAPHDGTEASLALDEYYRDNIIGGSGSFLVVANGFESFGQAVRRKIYREIAFAPPPGALIEYV